MPLTVEASGTQNAVIGTEHVLAEITAVRTLAAYVSLANMAAGDVVEIRVKIQILASGTPVLFSLDVFYDAQTIPLFFVPFMPSAHKYQLTLKQTAGTARSFDWQVLSYT